MSFNYIDHLRDDVCEGPRLEIGTVADSIRKAVLYAINDDANVYYELNFKAELDQVWLVLHCMLNRLTRYRPPIDIDDEAAKQRRIQQLDEASVLIAHTRNKIREIGHLRIPGEDYEDAGLDYDYPPSVLRYGELFDADEG